MPSFDDFVLVSVACSETSENIEPDASEMLEAMYNDYSEALQEIETLKAQLKSKLETESQLCNSLRELQVALADSSRCSLCIDSMSRPFTPGCGHVFCAPCLRGYFRSALESRLIAIPFLALYSTSVYDCHKAPTNIPHLKRTIAALQGDGLNPKSIFTYRCPLCRHETSTPPGEVVAMSNLMAIRPFAVEGDEYGGLGIPATKYFEGLFLQGTTYPL